MATKLLAWCAKRQVSLTAKLVPGKLNLLADSLSRKGQIIYTEWTLKRGTLSQIFHFWEVPHIDLFATRLNNQQPTFVFPFHDPLAWAVDVMSPVLGGNVSVCISSHPPFFEDATENGERDLLGHSDSSMLGKSPVLSNAVVSAGCSSDQTWQQDLLIQPHSRLTHPKPEIFNLHTWLCCREVSRRQDFLKDLPRESVPLIELPHSLSTITVGTLGWTGVSNGRWFPLIHL